MSRITKAEVAAFEADFRKRYLPLAKKLKKVEDDIYKLIIKSMSNAEMSTGYWNIQKVKLNELYREMNILFADWSKIQIPARYKRSLKLIAQRISATGSIINIGKKGLTELLMTNASTQIVFGLYSSAVESFLSSSLAGRRALRNLFITTQQTLVNESLVNVAVATGFQMGDLREAKSLLKSIFESPGWNTVENKYFIQAGSKRYTAHYYAEMVARTKFHQAHSQATLMQSQNYGTDLVQVSSHNTTTAICIPFEGNIYSISGTHKVFPPLVDTAPFHSNCLHLIYPTFESGLIAQDVLTPEGELTKQRDELLRAPGPVPKEISKVAGRPTTQALPNLTAKKGAESAVKSFGKSPAALQNVVDRHTNFNYRFLTPGKNGGAYSPSTSTISIGKNLKPLNRLPAIRHEIGHHIDYQMGKGIAWSNSGKFKTALDKDIGNLLGNVKQRTALNKTLSGSKIGDSSLSDLFDAATQGKVKGYFTHGRAYYTNKLNMIYGEPFANMTEIYGRSGTGGWGFLQKYLPETTKIYEQSVLGL